MMEGKEPKRLTQPIFRLQATTFALAFLARPTLISTTAFSYGQSSSQFLNLPFIQVAIPTMPFHDIPEVLLRRLQTISQPIELKQRWTWRSDARRSLNRLHRRETSWRIHVPLRREWNRERRRRSVRGCRFLLSRTIVEVRKVWRRWL